MKFEIIAVSQEKPLDGATIFRSNGEVIRIIGSSGDPIKLPLNGATLELTIRDYSTGISNQLVVKSTQGSGDNQINLDTQSPESLEATCKLVPVDTASLPPSEVSLFFKLDVISTELNHPITVAEGNFISKPDSV